MHTPSLAPVNLWSTSIRPSSAVPPLHSSTSLFLSSILKLFVLSLLNLPPWHLFVNSIPPLSILTLPSVSSCFLVPVLSLSSWSRPLAAVNLTADGLVFLARSLFLSCVCVCVCVEREREWGVQAGTHRLCQFEWKLWMRSASFSSPSPSQTLSLSLPHSSFPSLPFIPTLLSCALFFSSHPLLGACSVYTPSHLQTFSHSRQTFIFLYLAPSPLFSLLHV